jgi:hypothetical protein
MRGRAARRFIKPIEPPSRSTVSLAQGEEGLGAMWGEDKTREYLQKAGFCLITTRRLAHDIQNNW